MNILQRYVVIIGLLMGVFACHAFAGIDLDEPYVFMNDIIQVTKLIKSSADQFNSRETPPSGVNAVYLVTQTKKNFESAVSDIDRAQSLISEYKNSKNPMIKQNAEAMLIALGLLVENYQKTVQHFEKMYSAEDVTDSDAKDMTNEASKLTANQNEILKLCTVAASASTAVLLSDPLDGKKRAASAMVTPQQYNDLKKELEDFFGDDIKKGLKGVPGLSWAPAAVIYEFLCKDFYPIE